MGPVMMDVLEEHLDEAAFLWSQWESALLSPLFDLADTAEVEERLLAHLDGLVLGGESAVTELLLPALETEEAPRISAAAWALLAGGGKKEREETLAVFQAGDAVQRAGVRRALELSGQEGLVVALRKFLQSEEAAVRLLAFEALAFRGQAPEETRMAWLYRDDAEQVIAALREPRPLPLSTVQSILPQLLVDPRPGVRETAILAGLVSGARSAWKTCRKVAEEGGAGRRQCLLLLALGGEAQDMEWLVGLLREPALRSDVLWALGFSGHAAAAEACLEWMDAGPLAALAGEAFSAITGLKLEGMYRKELEEAAEALVPLEEEDLEANLVPGPEASLPVPLREAVASWWHKARKDFERGTRYLRGVRLGPAEFLAALRTEPMRRRHALALELAILSRGVYRLQTRAFTRQQRAELDAVASARASLSLKPFTKLLSV